MKNFPDLVNSLRDDLEEYLKWISEGDEPELVKHREACGRLLHDLEGWSVVDPEQDKFRRWNPSPFSKLS
jgi:hypothetical protein